MDVSNALNQVYRHLLHNSLMRADDQFDVSNLHPSIDNAVANLL
jgi:hypothetical protein